MHSLLFIHNFHLHFAYANECIFQIMGMQVSVTYLPLLLCTNESRVRFSVPALMCIWFPVQACFCRFPRVLRFSLLHLKLGFLNKSVSVCFLKCPLNLMPMHYWVLPGFPPNVINKNLILSILFYLFYQPNFYNKDSGDMHLLE